MFNGSSTADKPQSKVFYHDGSYWSVVQGPSGVGIYEKVGNNWELGAYMDALLTPIGTTDVKWNGTHLFVLVFSNSPSLFKYSYDDELRIWLLESGFPISLPSPAGAETMVLEQDSTGRLWATAEGDQKINVYYSTSSDHRKWGSKTIALQAGVDLDDISSIVAFNGHVGVFWSDQTRDEFGFRYHRDTDSPTRWSNLERVDPGYGHADDHVNLAVDASGRVYAVTKDDFDRTHLHRRDTDGTWTTVRDVAASVNTRGIVMVSDYDSRVYVLYTRWGVSPNTIEYRTATLDALDFGSRTTFIASNSNHMNDVSGMKQSLPPGGLMAIASSTSKTWWNGWGDPLENIAPPRSTDDLTVRVLASGEVELSWALPESGLHDGFNVYRQTGRDNFEKVNSFPILTNRYVDSFATGSRLCYQVTTLRQEYESTRSNTACLEFMQPGEPRNLRANLVRDGSTQGNLVLWFENVGEQYAADLSGSNNPARLGSSDDTDSGDPAWVPGAAGQALDFDGFDDYLYVKDAPSLDMPGSFTIEAWVQRRSARNGVLLNKGSGTDRSYRVLLNANGGIEFRWNASNGTLHEITTGPVLQADQWHHIACVYDEVRQENRIYVDGGLMGSGPAFGVPATNSEQLHVGTQLNSGLQDFFDGTIDQLRLSQGALYSDDFVPVQDPMLGSVEDLDVLLQWMPPLTGATTTGYHVYRMTETGSLLIASVSGLAFTDTEGSAATDCYEVRAVNVNSQTGAASNVACAEMGAAPVGMPRDLTVNLHAEHPVSVQLQWLAPEEGAAVAGYLVFRRIDGGSSLSLTPSPIPMTEFIDEPPVFGELCYRVQAVSENSSYGLLSEGACLTIVPPPPPLPSEPLAVQAQLVELLDPQASMTAAAFALDEGNGQTVTDSADPARTGLLGNSDGPDAHDPTWVSGISGTALAFSGDDFIQIDDAPGLRFENSFTIDVWLKREPRNGNYTILSKGENTRFNYWLRFEKTGKVEFAWENDQGEERKIRTGRRIDDDAWHHVAAVWDQDDGESRLFIDGHLEIVQSFGDTPGTSAGPLYIGVQEKDQTLERFYSGTLDQIRLSNVALYEVDFVPETSFGSFEYFPAVQVEWQPPTTGTVTGYDIYRRVDGSLFLRLNEARLLNTTFTDSSIVEGTLCYQIVAFNVEDLAGEPSIPACVQFGDTIDLPRLGEPQSLTASVQDSTYQGVELQWQAPAEGNALGYRLYRRANDEAWQQLNTAPIEQRSFLDGNPVNGELCYCVSGVDSLGREGALSAESCLTFSPPPPPLEAPRNPTATLVQQHDTHGQAAYDMESESLEALLDVTGNGHTGQLGEVPGADSNDPVWSTGISGSALEFDGANDHVKIAESPDLDLDGSFTLEAWFQRSTTGTRDCILSKGDQNRYNYYLMLTQSGYIDFGWEVDGGSNHGTMAGVTVTDNDWHHVAAIYDQEAGEDRIYLDGVLVRSAADSGTPVLNDDPVYLGTRLSVGSLSHFFSGSIDLVRISRGALYQEDFIPSKSFESTEIRSRVELAWEPPATGGAVGYNVYRQLEGTVPERLNGDPILETRFIDSNPPSDGACYTIAALDSLGQEGQASEATCSVLSTKATVIQSVDETSPQGPIFAASPNPFNPTTLLHFRLPGLQHVKLEVFDVRGQLVATLVDETMQPGQHEVVWQGRSSDGRSLASGAYFAVLRSAGLHKRHKLILLK